MHVFVLVLLFFLAAPVVSKNSKKKKELPEKFYGNYELDHSENFDEYLEAKGYGWLVRKFIGLATFKKEFKKSDKPGKFNYANLTTRKDVFYNDIDLGKKFVGEGLDSTKHEIVFDLVGNKLLEKHHPLEDGEAKDETYEYTFEKQDGKEYLVVILRAKDVVGKRFYKRI